MQFYDPNALITEVSELLRGHGLDPQVVDSALAQQGASMLIRALDAMPAINAVNAYSRSLEIGPWPDADDRRARDSGQTG
jgi:hypothetical protein